MKDNNDKQALEDIYRKVYSFLPSDCDCDDCDAKEKLISSIVNICKRHLDTDELDFKFSTEAIDIPDGVSETLHLTEDDAKNRVNAFWYGFHTNENSISVKRYQANSLGCTIWLNVEGVVMEIVPVERRRIRI